MIQKTREFWKLFGVLYAAGLAGVLAIMPYLSSLIEKLPRAEPLPFSMPVILVLQFFQSAVLLAIVVATGLLLARKIGLGAPIVADWLDGKKISNQVNLLPAPILIGGLTGVVLILLLAFVFVPAVPQLRTILASDSPIWKRFLATFYGGITEELLMRLFLFSLFAWLLGKVWHRADRSPRPAVFWLTNFLVAILFGLGHLPAAPILMIPINSIVVVAVLVLNGVAGIVFGYFYWKRGLEAAMIAHFSADIALHVIGPLFFKAT